MLDKVATFVDFNDKLNILELDNFLIGSQLI